MTEQELMLTKILNCRRMDLYINQPRLTSDQKQQLETMKKRRAQGEPLQYILGDHEFIDVSLQVDPRVLVPRPETEILVDLAEKALKEYRQYGLSLRLFDIGTGSGNIAISLAKHLQPVHITAIDISKEALACAQQNAMNNDVEQHIDFIWEDVFLCMHKRSHQRQQFDAVLSNPPYIPTSEIFNLPKDVQQEPLLALDGGADGLRYYREIISYCDAFLKPGGFLIMEIGDGQRRSIEDIFMHNPIFVDITFHKDHVGTDRVVIATKRHPKRF